MVLDSARDMLDAWERLWRVLPDLDRSADLAVLRGALSLRRLRKGAAFLKPQTLCAVEGLVTEGCLRVYRTDAEGVHRVLYFAARGWYVGDIASLVTKRPAALGIDALEPTSIWVFNRDTSFIDEPTRRVRDRLRRALRESLLVSLQTRLVGALATTAEERYLEFLRVYPGLDTRIAQYHVAAYLGVSPEFLSRMRRQLRTRSPLRSDLDLRQ